MFTQSYQRAEQQKKVDDSGNSGGDYRVQFLRHACWKQEPENMAMSTAGGSPSGPQMNVTPMIDVLLVLIIIFMVIVMQSKTKGELAQIPQPADPARNSAPPPERTIVIQLEEGSGKDDTPSVKINAEEVSWAELEPRLFDIYKQRAEKVVFVEGDDGVEFRFVADVIDQAREAGVATAGLMPTQMASARRR
jgi:biopolymer transport protein ExbD